MRFSKEWIQQLKAAVPLYQVVGENLNLRKAGRGFMGLCPFHGERSASFSVGADFYHCFGCKASGDVIKFMMELHALSFEEACEELAERGQIPLPQNTATDAEERAEAMRRSRIQKAARLNHFVALKYFHSNLVTQSSSVAIATAAKESHEYLKKRSISEQTIKDFQIGLAGPQPDGLVKFLDQSKAPLDLARDYGLIRPSQKQAGDYDLFRERLMFPLIDARGRICGFGGRILPEVEKSREARGEVKLPKYLNSTESELFQKSKYLYGLFQAKRAIREQETVVVVEGYFDVISLHQHGIQNVVATCGTALTEDHLKNLSRLAKKIIVFFDPDLAGITATSKAMEEALKLGMIVYGVSFPTQQDPDEFIIEKGAAALNEILANAYPLLDFTIDRILKDSETDIEKRSQAIKQITLWLEMYQDPVGRSLRVQSLTTKWRIPDAALGGLVKTRTVATPVQRSPEVSKTPQPLNQDRRPQASKKVGMGLRDRELLHFLVRFDRFGDFFYDAKKSLPEKDTLSVLFDDTEIKSWLDSLQSDPTGLTRLKLAPESCLSAEISNELRAVIMEGVLTEPVPGMEDQLRSLLHSAVKRAWAQFSQGLRRQMVEAESRQDIKKFEELSKQFLDLQKKLKELETSYGAGKSDNIQ